MADLEHSAAPHDKPIGRVDSAEGGVVAIRADGTPVALKPGDPVYQGDLLATNGDGAVALHLADDSTFSLGENGRMVLDELVYDPSADAAGATISVVEGVFVFVSGEIAKTTPDAMIVNTPVATIGVRGTKVAGRAAPEGEDNIITLLEEADGQVGEIAVTTGVGVQVLNQAFQTTVVNSAAAVPLPPQVIPREAIDDLYGRPLELSRAFDREGPERAPANDHGEAPPDAAIDETAPGDEAGITADVAEAEEAVLDMEVASFSEEEQIAPDQAAETVDAAEDAEAGDPVRPLGPDPAGEGARDIGADSLPTNDLGSHMPFAEALPFLDWRAGVKDGTDGIRVGSDDTHGDGQVLVDDAGATASGRDDTEFVGRSLDGFAFDWDAVPPAVHDLVAHIHAAQRAPGFPGEAIDGASKAEVVFHIIAARGHEPGDPGGPPPGHGDRPSDGESYTTAAGSAPGSPVNEDDLQSV